jgi:hypothetical protein
MIIDTKTGGQVQLLLAAAAAAAATAQVLCFDESSAFR